MAIAFTFRGAGNATTNASTIASGTTFTPAAGSLMIAFVSATAGPAGQALNTIAGNGVNYYRLASCYSANACTAVWLGIAPASPTSGVVTATWAGNCTLRQLLIFEVTGMFAAANSACAYQAVAQLRQQISAGATSMTINMRAGDSANRPIAGFCIGVQEDITPRANWTETSGADVNNSGPTTATAGHFRSDANEATSSATWTSNAPVFGLALEIREANVVGCLPRQHASLCGVGI